MTMTKWSQKIEDELSLLIKDWLKHKGRTRAELAQNLQASSTRMSAIIEELKKIFLKGGIRQVAVTLCQIELLWSKNHISITSNEKNSDPLGQLDLLLEEINEDCQN